jgi:hypothetical protein
MNKVNKVNISFTRPCVMAAVVVLKSFPARTLIHILLALQSLAPGSEYAIGA